MPLQHEQLTHAIIGAFYTVYNALGYGFLESVYAGALCEEFGHRRLPFSREHSFPVMYRGVRIATPRADLVVDGTVIVELKAVEHISGVHDAQLLNYLRASGLQTGLILNFGPKATLRRMVWTGRTGTLDDGSLLSRATP